MKHAGVVDSNTSNNEGGGISNSGTLTVIDFTISNNTSAMLDGGGKPAKSGGDHQVYDH